METNNTSNPITSSFMKTNNGCDLFKGKKVFDIATSQCCDFDELIKKSSEELNVEFAFFFTNSNGRQHGICKVVNGKIVKTTPLLEINVFEVVDVLDIKCRVKGYIVKYRRGNNFDANSVYIPISDMQKGKIMKYFDLPPQTLKKNDDLCERLLKEIIINPSVNAERDRFIVVGDKAGFVKYGASKVLYSGINAYPTEIQEILSDSIRSNNRPLREKNIYSNTSDYKCILGRIFEDYNELKVLFLIRISSYLQTFFSEYGIYSDQILCIVPNEYMDNNFWPAIFDNVKYSNNNIVMLSDKQMLKKAVGTFNDCVLLVIDDTSIDDESAREVGINILQKKVLGYKKDYLQIPVLISRNGALKMHPDLYCSFSVLDRNCEISSAVLAELFEIHDAGFIGYIENNSYKFLNDFTEFLKEISVEVPACIPANRRYLYYMLSTTMRIYNIFNDNFFDDKIEDLVLKILINDHEKKKEVDETILKLFGVCLNTEISNNRFNFIKRKKYIIFDQGSESVIVDDDNLYFETSVIQELIIKKLTFKNVDNLINHLKRNDCLEINDKNSNCYRFHVHNSNDEPYMLYTYGISKKIINAENRKKLELADYQKFLLDYADLDENEVLPFGITADGHYVGKDVSYRNKSNDSMFITGQSGNGKSFCATNLLPSLAMLGSRMLVFDVSKSFTHDEILRALPEEVVNALFEFIDVGAGQSKLPVNPLYIGDCTNLPAVKRRIMGFIKAVCKLEKDETKIVEGIISDALKKNTKITSISGCMLAEILKRGGKVGHKVYGLISSTLDDIELIGFEDQGWGEFFEKSKRIPVILLGDEVDSKVHTVLDVLVSSAFTWQRDHNTAPLSVVIDEIKMQNFSEGSPLHTILTQGRKFSARLIGITQQYISNGSHAIDVMKEAGIKIFFRPAKSLDRIAAELRYKSPADAGFASMGIGDYILSCDAFNKVDGINEPVVLHCKTIKFVDTPLYRKFTVEYHLT